MHEVLLHVVNLWDIVECMAWGTENIPRNSISDPLVLMNVSRLWSQFVTSCPQLWSHLLIDTDNEDVLEHLQFFLQSSYNTPLFIVLHGSAAVGSGIVAELLKVGDRIDVLVYPPSVPRSTFAGLGFHLRVPHDLPQHIGRWYELEVQSSMRRRRYMNSFPASIQSLWVDGLFLPSHLVTLPYFQFLSSLSMRISLDGDLPPVHHELELPTLERFIVQMALASHRQVDTAIFMICRNLKLLDLRYTLELDLNNLPEGPVTPMEFGVVDALKELQINLTIHEVNKVGPVDPLVGEWLQGLQRRRRRLEYEQQEQEWRRREREKRHLEVEQRRLERELPEWEELLELELLKLEQLGPEQLELERVLEQRKQEQQREQHLAQREQHLHLKTSIQLRLRQWLNLPNILNHVQQSSLKVMLSTRTHKEACVFIRNTIEEILMLRLPQLTELATSNILYIFPAHLQKLSLHGFGAPHSLPSINLPELVSLEINADRLDDLLVMKHIRVPQLLVLRVQVQDGEGELRRHDWRDTTSNPLEHISLRINIPRDKQGNYALAFFQLPQTHSLIISSPSGPLNLFLAELVPLSYTLHADLGAMSTPTPSRAPSQIDSIPAKWREALITEWINPHYRVPSLAKFRQLEALRRTVLDQRPYLLSKQSPTDEFFKLLAENIDICPHLTSITVSQCPSSWPRFMSQLRRRNREALLAESTKCIEELSFYQPLHVTIIEWLMDAIRAKIPNVIEQPPIRQGKCWPVRPVKEDEQVFRSCYICHITGMELGCQECETRYVDCGRERGDGSKIYAR